MLECGSSARCDGSAECDSSAGCDGSAECDGSAGCDGSAECDGSAGMRQQRESIRTMQKYGGNTDMEERQT